jgi:hypothetical protein
MRLRLDAGDGSDGESVGPGARGRPMRAGGAAADQWAGGTVISGRTA